MCPFRRLVHVVEFLEHRSELQYDDQNIQIHHKNLHKLCRKCGGTLSAGGRVSYCTSGGKGKLKRVFGID